MRAAEPPVASRRVPSTSPVATDFLPGVNPYREGYWDPDYEPKGTDLLCAFRIQPKPGVDMSRGRGGRRGRIVDRHLDRSVVERN